MVTEKKRLIEFYGTECKVCKEMQPLLDKLKKEEKLIVEKLEVWHDTKNAELLKQYDRGLCGGVPFFYNTASGGWICGSATYAQFKKWALKDKK